MKIITKYLNGVYNKAKYILVLPFLFLSITSCEDFINIPSPTTQVVNKTVFDDDQAALSTLSGLYSSMAQSFMVSSRLPSFSSDELLIHTTNLDLLQFYQNSLTPENSSVTNIWLTSYRIIFYANTILEGMSNSNSLTQNTRNILEGESKFIRAYAHFILTNYFGEIPYIISTDYQLNATVHRQPVEEIFNNLILDLLDAERLLKIAYPSQGRTRPNKFTATALLARVYLYNKQWAKAEQTASEIINQPNTYTLIPPQNVFLSNSPETIWQVMPVLPQLGVEDSFYILLSPPNFLNYASLRPELVNTFEQGDLRRTHWIGSITAGATTFYFSHKYKVRNNTGHWPEYNMMFRLAEQYLIRAEARTQLGNISGAKSDLDIIRTRAGLSGTIALSVNELLVEIENERLKEFFTENAHRWFDLKRTGRADEVLVQLKPNWKPEAVLYPLPLTEIQNNKNLLPQNLGY